MSAIFLSLQIASIAVLTVMPVAICLARYLSQRRQLHVRVFVEAVVALPLVLPPVAIGYLLLILFSEYQIAFTRSAAIIAACVVSLPLAVRSVRVSMENLNPHLEEAALNLGLSKWKTFCRITLPLAWPGILSGAVLVFIRSLGEFGATLMFAGNIEGQTRTLSIAMWNDLQSPGGEEGAFRLLVFSVIFSMLCLLLSEIIVWKMRK